MRHGLCLLLLTVCLGTGSPLVAQNDDPSASHSLLPGGFGEEDLQKQLADRLGKARQAERLKKLLNELLKDPGNLGDLLHKDVAKMIQEAKQDPRFDPNDRQWKDIVEKFKDRAAQKLKGEDLDPEKLKQLIPKLDPPPDKLPEGSKPPEGPDSPNPGRPMPPAPAPPAPPEPAPEEGGLLRNSWIRDLVGKLRPGTGGTGMRNWLRDTIGRDGAIGRLTRGLGLNLRGIGSNLAPRNLRLGRLFGGRPNVSLPRVSGPSMSGSSAGSLGKGVMMGVALLAVGVLVWVVLAATGRLKGGEQDGWRLGPWPVDPRGVRTRSDLVKAFEHLAMLLLGRGAVTANHVDLGGRLANDQGARQEAAAELAELYEQARYAPPQERLTDNELDRARRDLCLLAGVESA